MIGGAELKVWKIEPKSNDKSINQTNVHANTNIKGDKNKENKEDEEVDDEDDEDETCLFNILFYGSVLRESLSRFSKLNFDKAGRIIVYHGKDSLLEGLKIRTNEEVMQHIRKKERKERKMLKRSADGTIIEENGQISIERSLKNELERLSKVKLTSKIKFCDIYANNDVCKIATLMNDNSFQVHLLNLKAKACERICSLENEGHRTDVRSVAFSSDDLFICSVSGDSLKIWNRASRKCIVTISDQFEYALTCLFGPADKYCITGTKTGKLQIFDLSSAEIIETIEASENGTPIWSICSYPDGKGIVSGGEDKTVKFWDFEAAKLKETTKKGFTLVHSRTLQMDEGVLCVRISPNFKLLAVSLLDCTVKIFYFDTLKFFLSLFGHKLPVLCMDISYDNKFIATGSSDKNVKIWGLDFGDCHKSIFAHDNDITSLSFIPKTHYFFTSSKDKLIKQWDADIFQKIVTLNLHQAEVWSLAVSSNGQYLVSASHDKTLRVWEETEEPLILEEEQENEREEEYEKMLENEAADHFIAGEDNQESGLPLKSTKETTITTDRLLEALEVFKEEVKKLQAYKAQCEFAKKSKQKEPAAPASNPLMLAYNTNCPYYYILQVLERIKSNQLEEVLFSLPFHSTIDLIKILTHHLDKGWELELVLRCLCFLTR